LHKVLKAGRLQTLLGIYKDVRESQEDILKTLDTLIQEEGEVHVYVEGFSDVQEPHLQDPYFLEGAYFGNLSMTEDILEDNDMSIPLLNSYSAIRAMVELSKVYNGVKDLEFDDVEEFFDVFHQRAVDTDSLNHEVKDYAEKTEEYLKSRGVYADDFNKAFYITGFCAEGSINEWKNDIIGILTDKIDEMKDVEEAKLRLKKLMITVFNNANNRFKPYRLIPGAALVKAMKKEVVLHHLDNKELLDDCIAYVQNGGSVWDEEFERLTELREDYMIEQYAQRPLSVIVLGGNHNLTDNAETYMRDNPNSAITIEARGERYGLAEMILSEE